MELKLKIGAKVMLTYNIDTSDGLTNGARGEIIGTVEDAANRITKIIIKFDNENHGYVARQRNTNLTQLYPDGTPIEKVNFSFSISRSKNSVINTANVIQFPLKLAFASTAHKIQGATILKPMKMIISVDDIWAAALVYVMLSRICALWQLYILDDFDETKMYPSQTALKETERLRKISKEKDNTNIPDTFIIGSLNCRSLKKHFEDVSTDDILLNSDVFCCQETWIEEFDDHALFGIEGFNSYFISIGKGKGIAIYSKKNLLIDVVVEIKRDNLQLAKLKSELVDIILLYKSKDEDPKNLERILVELIDKATPTVIAGDFNLNFMDAANHSLNSFVQYHSFSKLVNVPTHIEGNGIDQVLVRDIEKRNNYEIDIDSKYYTDHKGISVIIKR